MITGLEDRTKNFGFILSLVGYKVGKMIELPLDENLDTLFDIAMKESKQAEYRFLDEKIKDIVKPVTQWEPGDAFKNERIPVRQFYFVKP